MTAVRLSFLATFSVFTLAGPIEATSCQQWPQFASSLEYLQPLSVPAARIGDHMSAAEWSDGVEFASELRGNELWLDITRYPSDTTAIAGTRAILIVGRLADDSFDRLVLSDADRGIFSISEPDIRSIGCQFIWGVEGGENPIALLRDLYSAMTHYETGRPLSTRWNGSLLGDTNLALELNNGVLVPGWVRSAVE